ncbi:MAG: glutamine amidotransferase family protein [Dehalococcoidales bacterium]|jgi:glutamate synthase domain-containing protein 1|nr:glutamine amidotransferase family protein [Dehalococcoidales bacterium]
MKELNRIQNPYHDDKVIDACSIFGAMDTTGKRFSGQGVIRAIANMHDRGNGLGGGFAIYGLYPEYTDLYAFHIMYLSQKGKQDVEAFLRGNFHLIQAEEVPNRLAPAMVNPPLVWRYFLEIGQRNPEGQAEDDYVVGRVMEINTRFTDAFVFSSGKDMAVFKGVGYPEEIAEYFCLEQYEGYLWTAHGRFPTNTPGWWGGAHPFCILDWTVVHNGEISSYGINRRYLEQFGYHCTMQTDTEVVAYAIDLLMRKHGLPIEIVARVLAPPLWRDIEQRPLGEQKLLRTLRQVYSSLLLNGPFTVIIAHHGEMIGLTDRIRLRPLTVGTKDNLLYLSSEESAIRLICPDLNEAWNPIGGEPVIGRLGTPLQPSPMAVTKRVPVLLRESKKYPIGKRTVTPK